MQLQPTYKDRRRVLNEIGNLLDARDIIYEMRWQHVPFNSDEFQFLTRVYDYLNDLTSIKYQVIYQTLNDVAADS